MTLLYDEVRDAVAERRVDERTDAFGRPKIALSVRFARPLEPRVLSVLERERRFAIALRSPEVVAPEEVEISPTLVTLLLDPLDPAAIRLDTLMSALAWSNSPLGSPISAYVVTEAARILQGLHGVIGPDGTPCVHRELHAGTLLVTAEGRITLVGPGLPALSAVMIPRLKSEADRYRLLGPEAARGEPLDPRADIYSLGVLYYQLLAGSPYRKGFGAGTICQVAIEGRPPDLPGDLPDPRPGLLETLACALAADKAARYASAHDLGEAVRAELAAASIALPSPSVLRRMIDEFVPAGAERGEQVLLSVEHDPAVFEALMSGTADTVEQLGAVARTPRVRVPTNTPTTPGPPAERLLALSEPSSDLGPAKAPDPWSSVLGESLEGGSGEPPPKPTALPLPDERPSTESTLPLPDPAPSSGSTLPLPDPAPSSGSTLPLPDPAPSSGSTLPLPDDPKRAGPTRPLSSERLTALTSGSPTHPRPPPAEETSKKSLSTTIAVGAGGILLAGLVAFAVDEPDADPPPRPSRPTATIDAGIVSNHPTLRRRDAGRLKEDQPKPLGLLSVLSKPSGATVELDGGYIGETPLVLRHQFENRFYRLRVLADGYEPWEKEVRPDPKLQSISVMAVMEKK